MAAWIFLPLLLLSSLTQSYPLTLQNSQGEHYQIHTYLTLNKSPTIIALHGCGGMLNARGEPNLRTVDYAQLLNIQGWHVVYLDSFTARGVKTVCGGKNDVTQAQRLQDVRAAVAYLAQQTYVDPQRIALLGWSHGGTATLIASAQGVRYAVQPKAAVAFYPGCGNDHRLALRFAASAWKPAFPIRMFLGEADDWTDPAPCKQLAAMHGIEHTSYANAHHGFDSTAPVRAVKSVISRKSGQPVHAGGEPSARVASQAAMIEFFQQAFK